MYARGVGVSAPGVADNVTLPGSPVPPERGAPGQLLPPALRRRATGIAVLVADAIVAAARPGGADLSRTPIVFASAHGEIATAVEMMRSFGEAPGLPSPTRFHNSVHNTAAAYTSIATSNRGFSSALAAGEETVAAALIEVAALFAERGGDVLLAFADEPVPPPLGPFIPLHPAAAVAFHLCSAPGPGRARLSGMRRAPAPAPELPGGLAAHPCAGAFALAAAIARSVHAARTVALGPFGDAAWVLDLEPAGSP